jgi:hypothetical protein
MGAEAAASQPSMGRLKNPKAIIGGSGGIIVVSVQ